MERHIGTTISAVILALAALFYVAPAALAQNAFERAYETYGAPKPVEQRDFNTDIMTKRTVDDIRRQKEEASESLNNTLKDIDERAADQSD